MMKKLKLLDLFCGAGGTSMGYHRAGFEVVGVDIIYQPHYPFEFHQADVLTMSHEEFKSFDVIHASPPCQKFSQMSRSRPEGNYEDLISKVRSRIKDYNYVIENVIGSPLIEPMLLCGRMFNLDLYRHRIFESSLYLPQLAHPEHIKSGSKAGHIGGKYGWQPGKIISVAGHCNPMSECKRVMEIDWMTQKEIAQAIPPAYTEYIGKKIIQQL